MELGTGKWLNASVNVLAWSVTGRLMVLATLLPFAFTVLTVHLLTASHRLAPASAADWFNKGRAMCYHVYVIVHEIIPNYLSQE